MKFRQSVLIFGFHSTKIITFLSPAHEVGAGDIVITMFLFSIPLLPSSGKLDKKALPPLGEANTVVDAEGMATTVTEKRLLPLWAEVLQIQVLDIQDSFFDLGGSVLYTLTFHLHVNTVAQ